MKINLTGILIAILFVANPFQSKSQISQTVHPGAVWPDHNGNHIQAHGGGIILVKGTYYWYGEERRKGRHHGGLISIVSIKLY